MDSRTGLLLEKLPRPEVEELVLEEVPDISYAGRRRPRQPDRGHHRRRRAAVPAPGPVHRAQAAGAQGHPALRAPRAAARPSSPRRWPTPWPRRWPRSPATRPPGPTSSTSRAPSCSTSTWGRPSARSAWSSSGPGRRARRACPVIVFFDEMDSLFRTRGTGISSDMESTIVPQLLAEIDGVETLKNVIVIGASNREDLIDPAILRPGPPGREDQDRATRRGGRGPDLLPLPDLGPAPRRGRGHRPRWRRPGQGRAAS